MRRSAFLVLAWVTTMLALGAGDPASAQRGGGGRWVKLGEQSVGFLIDKDKVVIGRDEGWLRTLRISARGNDVRLLNVRIHYQNGYTEDFPNNQTLRANGTPVVIDLRGERSFLRDLELTYRSRPSFKGKATVVVEGRVVRPR